MIEPGYLMAATTGLIGGFGHCIGMCGPIVASSALRTSTAERPAHVSETVVSQSLYNAGRITTYALIGAFMGLTGSFLNVAAKLAGIQNLVMIVAGIFMIVMGLGILGISPPAVGRGRFQTPVLVLAGRLMRSRLSVRFYLLGAVLGLLPCGLSYTMYLAAAATGTASGGSITMFSFGLGTAPALLLFGVAIGSIGLQVRRRLRLAGGVSVALMGLYYIGKGISLYGNL